MNFGQCAPGERLIKIDDCGRSQCVQRRTEVRHARRENRRHHQSRDSGRQIAPDEIGIQAIAHRRRGAAGIGVVHKQQHADDQE
jgi:hypothetical protein